MSQLYHWKKKYKKSKAIHPVSFKSAVHADAWWANMGEN